jgi:hypothetical protein
MSLVKVQGNVSGTGTLTIAAPNTNSDHTLTLPDQTGTILTTATAGVPVNGPAFSAWAGSATSLSNAVATKVLFNTKEFDTNTNYDASLSRFTPTVAGYYQVTSSINTAAYISVNSNLAVYKNGLQNKVGIQGGNSGNAAGLSVSALIYMNGSTDYLEIYAYHASGGAVNTTPAQAFTYFQAFLARSAT